MKRIATIQDISCVGKCSLSVALPIISALGAEAAAVPTAVLSTHTAFRGFTFRDLTPDIPGILRHWKQEKIHFDAVYSGYLASREQIRLVEELFGLASPGALRIVDPVMGDHGRLYTGFDDRFPEAMRELCASADVILPNLTEACLLAGTPYRETLSGDESAALLRRLAELGPRYAVLTGSAAADRQQIGALCFDRAENRFCAHYTRLLSPSFHGTGDIFASTMAGALVRGLPIDRAMALAVDFTAECIRRTPADPPLRRFGVHFEAALPWLIRRIGQECGDADSDC